MSNRLFESKAADASEIGQDKGSGWIIWTIFNP